MRLEGKFKHLFVSCDQRRRLAGVRVVVESDGSHSAHLEGAFCSRYEVLLVVCLKTFFNGFLSCFLEDAFFGVSKPFFTV